LFSRKPDEAPELRPIFESLDDQWSFEINGSCHQVWVLLRPEFASKIKVDYDRDFVLPLAGAPTGFSALATPLFFAPADEVRASSLAFGRARDVGLFVSVAIFGFAILADFAMPIFDPKAAPRVERDGLLTSPASSYTLPELVRAPLSIGCLVPEADLTLPAPVITADGFLFPRVKVESTFTGRMPGRTIICSGLLLLEVVLVVAIILLLSEEISSVKTSSKKCALSGPKAPSLQFQAVYMPDKISALISI
jgi:hypothetical protein